MDARIFYQDGDVTVRTLMEQDIEPLCREEALQGWPVRDACYRGRLQDMAQGRCVALCALWHGEPAGYVNLYDGADDGPYAGAGLPQIVDFAVLEKYRRRGIGTRLMDVAERLAAARADAVCLAVGSAQRIRQRAAHVCQARLRARRHRRVVSRRAAGAVRALCQRRRPGAAMQSDGIHKNPAADLRAGVRRRPFLYKENHSLGEWFKKAYGGENDKKTPFAIIKVRSANCTNDSKGRTFRWD